MALGYESCRDVRNITETKGIFDEERKVSLGDIAISNNAADSLWCVRALNWDDIAIRRRVISQVILPAVKRASANTTDVRVAECIAALQQWCDGDDAVDLAAAADAAAEAAYAACDVSTAATAAADAATDTAAYAAAVSDAATEAAAYTAYYATYATDAAADAATDAAAEAATDTAGAAIDAAAEAADTADDAADYAGDAERERQRQDIIAAFPPVLLSQKDDA